MQNLGQFNPTGHLCDLQAISKQPDLLAHDVEDFAEGGEYCVLLLIVHHGSYSSKTSCIRPRLLIPDLSNCYKQGTRALPRSSRIFWIDFLKTSQLESFFACECKSKSTSTLLSAIG